MLDQIHLLVIGAVREREALAVALEGLAPLGVGVDNVSTALARLDDATSAVLLLGGESPRAELRMLVRQLAQREIPVVLLISPGTLEDADATELYDMGATVVLAWPAEALLVEPLLTAILGGASEPTADAETPLSQAVRARLVADPVLASTIDVSIVDGTALLRGSVDSAWERSRLRRLVAAVPGIVRVVDHGVSVHIAEIDDKDLRGVAEATVRSAGNAEARALHVDVRAAVATVSGTATSRITVTRVCNALRQVVGIRRVYDGT